MSYILDALKKLETEKERKAHGSGMVNIAGELFKNSPATPKAHRNWPLILGLVSLASLFTFGATFLFLHGSEGKKRVISASSAPTVSTAPPPVIFSSSPMTKLPAAVAPRHVAPLPAQAPKDKKEPSLPRRREAVRPVMPTAAQAARAHEEPSRPAEISLVAAPAEIKVSGIAWQDHRPSSRVVVNGFLLKEGDTVSGARIVEIFQNRVRFSSAAGTFEVYLVANGLSGPAK